jgi:hypothetical protein
MEVKTNDFFDIGEALSLPEYIAEFSLTQVFSTNGNRSTIILTLSRETTAKTTADVALESLTYSGLTIAERQVYIILTLLIIPEYLIKRREQNGSKREASSNRKDMHQGHRSEQLR